MDISIEHGPAFALAVIQLADGESCIAEAGAMVSKDSHVTIDTAAGSGKQGLLGGLLAGAKRMVAGESFFRNTFTGAGELTLAPTHVGDIASHALAGRALFLQSSAFLCHGTGVTLDASWGGAKGFFSGQGMVLLKATGDGPILFNGFGAIKEMDIDGELIVDNGHIVAFDDGLSFSIERFGSSWRKMLLGGEGLVCRFRGQGKLWLQTRNAAEFGGFVGPKLPPREA